MGGIVAAIAMTHTPGLGDRVHEPPPDQMARLLQGFSDASQVLRDAKPDLVVALVNDHFDMYCLDNMPTFSISVSDEHWGPPESAEAWLQMKRRRIAGNEAYAMALLRASIRAGFDMTRAGTAELVHNVLMPYKYLLPDADLPVVPVFCNCFVPPLPSLERCHALGRVLGREIASRSERVALIASGGISHWPPFAKEDGPMDDELNRRMLRIQRLGPAGRREDPGVRALLHKREAEMAASDRELINVRWDLSVMAAMERGDSGFFADQTYEAVERDGGNGGHEIAMWAMLMGALGDRKARTVVYEPVKEWMGGVGVVSYDRSLVSARRDMPARAQERV